MLSNKYFAFSAILLAVGCTGPKRQENILSKLENKATPKEVAVRQLASMSGDKCLPDIFNLSTVQEEVSVLEKKFESGKKVSGKWKHLDLSELPIAQAQFLKSYGDKIGDRNNLDAFDYSNCQSVPCIINKIYEKEDSLAGYVHYLWYLKMGNLLAPTNFVYNPNSQQPPGKYNGKDLKVSDYLYNDKEIFAVWRMLKLLKEPFTVLTDLKEIYRLPRGHYFDQQGSSVCGEAWSSGYINMQDNCLSLSSNGMMGYFFQSFIHELAHQVDYHEMNRDKKYARPSNSEEYLNTAGFYLVEYKNEKGETVKQWKLREGTPLPSGYAGTKPAENFAEALSQYRVAGELMIKNMSAAHRDLVAKKYYGNEQYTNAAIIEKWIKQREKTLNQSSFQAVGNCMNEKNHRSSAHLSKADLKSWLTNNQVACLSDKFIDIEKEFTADVKVYDPDGCNVLTPNIQNNQLRPLFKKHVVAIMNRYLEEVQNDSEYFARIEGLIAKLDKKDIAREAFLTCYESKSEKTCYETNVVALYLKSIEDMNIPADQKEDLAMLYLENQDFNSIVSYASGFYRDFARSHLSAIRFETEELFSQCTRDINDDLPPVGTHISLGEGYLVSSVFNCINAHFPDSVKQLVRDVRVDGMEVKHAKEEEILNREFSQLLASDIKGQYEELNTEEKVKIQEFIASDKSRQIRTQLVSDFSWVRDVIDDKKLLNSCVQEVVRLADIQVVYHLKSKVLADLANEACYKIQDTSEYGKWLVESKDVFETKVKGSVDSKIIALGIEQADACIGKYPMNTNVERIKFKSEREACLVDAWPSLESKVLESMKKDEMVVKFKIDVEKFRSTLESTRRRLQLKVIKEKF